MIFSVDKLSARIADEAMRTLKEHTASHPLSTIEILNNSEPSAAGSISKMKTGVPECENSVYMKCLPAMFEPTHVMLVIKMLIPLRDMSKKSIFIYEFTDIISGVGC